MSTINTDVETVVETETAETETAAAARRAIGLCAAAERAGYAPASPGDDESAGHYEVAFTCKVETPLWLRRAFRLALSLGHRWAFCLLDTVPESMRVSVPATQLIEDQALFQLGDRPMEEVAALIKELHGRTTDGSGVSCPKVEEGEIVFESVAGWLRYSIEEDGTVHITVVRDGDDVGDCTVFPTGNCFVKGMLDREEANVFGRAISAVLNG